MREIDEKYKLKDLSFKQFVEDIKNIFSLMSEFKFIVLLSIVLSLCATFVAVIAPKVMATAVNSLFYGLTDAANSSTKMDLTETIVSLSIALGLYILQTILGLCNSLLGVYSTQKACYTLRKKIMHKISSVQLFHIEKQKRGDVISRLTIDVNIIANSYTGIFIGFIKSTTLLIGSIIMMLQMSWFLTLVVLVTVPFTAFLSSLIVKKTQKFYSAQQQLYGEMNSVIEETISGLPIVHVFNRQEKTKQTFKDLNDEMFELSFQKLLITLFMSPIVGFLGNFNGILITILGGWLAIIGQFSVGGIQAFLQYVGNFSNPLNSFVGLVNGVQQISAAVDRVYEFLDYEDEVAPEKPMVPDANTLNDSNIPIVSFKDVTFSYDGKTNVINNFNLDVYKGQTIAIVGPTGAGKTTLVKLLMRFYDVDQGSIKVHDIDIKNMKHADIRSNFGMVLQNIFLFWGTVKENIAYGRLDASDEDIIKAAQLACCDNFIQKMPNKYDTQLWSRSRNLSIGQRQLICISRAILADRDIMILDEATSNVDTITEKKLYSAFDFLIKEKTSFVIAHRLSTIKNADKILVINNGSIVESGTHDELLKMGGFYSELYNAQFEK